MEKNNKFYKVAYYTIEVYDQENLGTQYVEVDSNGKRKTVKVSNGIIDAIKSGNAQEVKIEVKEEPKKEIKKQEEPATAKQIWMMDRNQISYPVNVSKKYASFLIEQGLRG